jgi:hypothetical protein
MGLCGFRGAVRTGLEPATLGVTGRYSNQLNYRTKIQKRCKINGFFNYTKEFTPKVPELAIMKDIIFFHHSTWFQFRRSQSHQ